MTNWQVSLPSKALEDICGLGPSNSAATLLLPFPHPQQCRFANSKPVEFGPVCRLCEPVWKNKQLENWLSWGPRKSTPILLQSNTLTFDQWASMLSEPAGGAAPPFQSPKTPPPEPLLIWTTLRMDPEPYQRSTEEAVVAVHRGRLMGAVPDHGA